MESEIVKVIRESLLGQTGTKEADIDGKEGKKQSSHVSIWENQQDTWQKPVMDEKSAAASQTLHKRARDETGC